MVYIECNPMQREFNLDTVSIDNASMNSVKGALFVIERINKLKLVRFLCRASILHIGERVESCTELQIFILVVIYKKICIYTLSL